MCLHFMAQAVHIVLQLSPHRFESVTNRHTNVFVRTLDFQMLVRLRLPLVHQVSDWCSGAAAKFDWMREAKRENTRCGL